MGANKYTSNAAVSVDCTTVGATHRVELSKLMPKYHDRVALMEANQANCLARHGFYNYKQKVIQLRYYSGTLLFIQ